MAPPIIARASVAANSRPFALIVSTRVASATDGAAPKIPAKLFGRSTSPERANNVTNTPPTMNLITSSTNIRILVSCSPIIGPRIASPNRSVGAQHPAARTRHTPAITHSQLQLYSVTLLAVHFFPILTDELPSAALNKSGLLSHVSKRSPVPVIPSDWKAYAGKAAAQIHAG